MSTKPFYIGLDLASGPDRCVETVCRALPDGRVEVLSTHSYSQTIDLGPEDYSVRAQTAKDPQP